MILHSDIIVFDTETTGLNKPNAVPVDEQPRITEFAAIKLNDNLEEIDRLEFLVNPGEKLTKAISNLTGITDDMLADQGPFESHLSKLQHFFLGVREMVAHNLMFDHDILMHELRRLDKVTQFPWPIKRTCTIEKTMKINNRRLKLSDLHKYCFGKEFSGAHRAMVDVEALVRCFVHLKEEGLIK